MPRSNKRLKGHLRSIRQQRKSNGEYSPVDLKNEEEWIKAQMTINRLKGASRSVRSVQRPEIFKQNRP